MKRILVFVLLSFILKSCANIQLPVGGDEDKTPPQMIGSNPANRSTNFKGDRITLEFDEPIETKNLSRELIISPNHDIKYKEKPSKTSITLKFKDTLRSNTTYTFNFGNSIIDMTEKNPAQNAQLAFSTGSYIDTAFFEGNVLDMVSQEPLSDVVVVLAPDNDTFNIEKHKPLYVARSDSGYFSMQNLPDSNFIVYAIQDLNGNFTYNPGTEKIARYPDVLKPTYADSNLIELTLAQQNTKPFKINFVDHHPQFSVLKFSKGIEYHNITKDTISYLIQDNAVQLYVFHSLAHGDSILQSFQFIDSIGQQIDTVFALKSDTTAKKFDKKFSYTQIPEKNSIIQYTDSLIFDFNINVKQFLSDSILIIVDGQDTINESPLDIRRLYPSEYIIRFPFDYRRSINIEIPHGNIVSVFGDTLPKQNINITLPADENTGRISGSIKTDKSNILIELINANKKVVRRLSTAKAFNFPFLQPDTYRIRAIEDTNGNGRWDAGDYRINIQPENVYYYEEKILLKANWIQEGKVFEF